MKVADPWACQNLQEALLEEFQDFQGVSVVCSNIFFVAIFKIFSDYSSFSIVTGKYLCRAGQQPIITSTTVEVVVPRNLVPVIYGVDGECLKQIRQVSLICISMFDILF